MPSSSSSSSQPSKGLNLAFVSGFFICFFTLLVPLILPSGSWMAMFPRRRTSLTSVLTDKIYHDRRLLEDDKTHWYSVQASRLTPDLMAKFVLMSAEDEGTQHFIRSAVDKSDSVFLQLWHNLAKSFLSFFYSQTDINGYLGRGSMFVLSQEQFVRLMAHGGVVPDPEVPQPALIDLGAGDGGPTGSLMPFFQETFATEASPAMRAVLRSKGVRVQEIEDWHESRDYDFVSCLNLLDRCDAPLELLAQIKSALKPSGLLLVALVLPFKPCLLYTSPSPRD